MAILYLFDIDGTLLRADGAGARAFETVLASMFGITDGWRGVRFGGKTDPQILDEILILCRGAPATADERARFMAAYLPRLEAELADSPGFRVLPGVIAALDWLAGRADVVLGIATGNIAEGARAKLTRAGLAERFRVGGYGSDASDRAELVSHAIARGRAAGAQREVVVVGDTIHDIAAARACGAVAAAVATGADERDALVEADVVWDALDELPAWHTRRFV